MRIVTRDFPKYFAIVSRIREEMSSIDPAGGILTSSVRNGVQILFPVGAVTEETRVGVQVS